MPEDPFWEAMRRLKEHKLSPEMARFMHVPTGQTLEEFQRSLPDPPKKKEENNDQA